MSQWYGNARSNYFRVKDKEKFKELCNSWFLSFIEEDNKVGFLCDGDNGGLPSYKYESDVELNFDDFLKELSECLIDEEVAILFEVGSEKLAYLTGVAYAINNKNEQKRISLEEIYERAKPLGKNIETII